MKDIPLVVDLDGTLIHTDTLYESFFKFIKNAPFKVYQICLHLLIIWLKAQKEAGRKLILCTASYHTYAQKIAEHLGFFDEVIASSESNNLKGKQKSKLLNARYGIGNYQYVGNSSDDIHVWKNTQNAVLVNAKKNLAKKVKKHTNIEFKIDTKTVSGFGSI